ncbi:MAG: MFS transporter [Methanomicrobium sp.]|nr:MFS transporter [Methanomicrobium sp.]
MYAVEDNKNKNSFKFFDYAGVVTLSITMTSFLFALSQGSTLGWNSPVIISLLVIFILFLILFIICEKRHPSPIIDINIFRTSGFFGSVLFLVVFEILLGGMEFVLPFYLENVLLLTPDISGLYLLIPPLIMIIAGPAGGAISDYERNRVVCSLAGFLAAVAFAGLFFSPGAASQIYLVIGLIIFGISIGTVASSGANRIIEQCHDEHKVTGSAVSNLVFYVGMSIGTAIYALIVQESLSSGLSGIAQNTADIIPPVILTGAMYHIYIFSFILAIAALLVSLSVTNRDIS